VQNKDFIIDILSEKLLMEAYYSLEGARAFSSAESDPIVSQFEQGREEN
jgi:hypothetical protein